MHVDTPEQAKIRAALGFICNWTGGHCPRGCASACTYEVIDARTDEVIARNDLNSAQPTVEHSSTQEKSP